MAELSLRLTDGAVLVLPASLDAITTYVVLEQEAWFEKEPVFLWHWLKPGMTAIDIGANLGVYAIPVARLVAPHGQVFAYEPGSAARVFLEKSRVRNNAGNLHVIAAALSDTERCGHLVLGASSELNRLDHSGPGENGNEPGEPVQIACLDAEDARRSLPPVDFVKIDAEGEEERILDGGKSFFERHSPLVLFEIKAGHSVNERLRAAFRSRGYGVYRLLPGAPVLVADDATVPIDGYELNLFAAKPDRAAALARDGFLVGDVPDWAPDEADRAEALALLRAQSFATDFASLLAPGVRLDAEYLEGLAGYAAWRSPRPLAERCGALAFALDRLISLCTRAASPPRLSSLARIAWEAGARVVCVTALRHFLDIAGRGDDRINEPFWPAAPRFDVIAPHGKTTEWFAVSALEQFERTAVFSSYFGDNGLNLDWLGRQPLAAPEIERRRVLRRARAGEQVEVPARLCVAAPDHINADVWRGGLVPNTCVRPGENRRMS
jgi:FkbM family methyltransferase